MKTSHDFTRQLLLVAAMAGVLWLPSQPAGAETVYRCQDKWHEEYTAHPAEGRNCRPVELHVSEPDPEDVARAILSKQRQAAEDAAAVQQVREERAIRAQEAAAAAAQRRAIAVEEQLRLLQQRQDDGYGHAPGMLRYPLLGIGVPIPPATSPSAPQTIGTPPVSAIHKP